jgi:release factor glutamine methyltransferase
VINTLGSHTIANSLIKAAARLREGAVAQPRRQAASLLAHVLGRDRGFLITRADDLITESEVETFESLIARRVAGEPTQYLTGHQEFFKLDFEVTPAVLIPRPETELIVEAVLELIDLKASSNLADICTGSGCIAISLLHEMPHLRCVAGDISRAALEVTFRNAHAHNVADRLTLVESDCFAALATGEQFDVITSNPPYVSDDELRELQVEVRFEPQAALAGGPDGLEIIRRLLVEARSFLKPNGYFIFEIGFGQRDAVEKLIDTRMWRLFEVRADLQGIPRTFVLQRQ